MAVTIPRPGDAKKALRRRIRATKKELRRMERNLRKMENAPRELDPHQQAGPKNVELMRRVFLEGRVLTAAEATRRAGSKAGYQVWAMRALLKEGQIEETGRTIGVSKQYRWVGAKRRKATRLGPGQ
jgi:RIO-like serine/threonine protein kinase